MMGMFRLGGGFHGRWLWAAVVMLLAILPHAVGAESVRISETEETFSVTDKGDTNPRDLKLRRVRMENEYLRVDLLPRLGGRVSSVFDKAAGKERSTSRASITATTTWINGTGTCGAIRTARPR